MSRRRVTTQAEFDAAVTAGDEPEVWSGEFRAYGSATVRAYDSATVWAYGSATVWAYGSATVWAYDSATVRAYGSATVWAYGSATVRAYGSATVRAYDSATVRAYDSATVQANDSATVWAYGSATVWAYDSATVWATPCVPVHDFGPAVTITGGIPISVRRITNPTEWANFHGLDHDGETVTVYKAVEADWCGGNKHDAITYQPGDTPEAHDWKPTAACGAGLHFVPRPWEGDQYLNVAPAAHYVACRVRLDEMVVLDDKVKARRVVAPITECDLDGEPLPTGADR